MTTDLKQLWQEAFAEAPELFFSAGFSPNRFRRLYVQDQLAGAVYWFDLTWEGRKYAYIYGLATAKALRGRGYGKRLMHHAHQQLRAQGYQGVILVPAQSKLFAYYEKMGYEPMCSVREFTCQGQGNIAVNALSRQEYAQARQTMLPTGAVLHTDRALRYFQGYGSFWGGQDWVLAGSLVGQTLYVQEFLGDPELAPAITASLGAKNGLFRTPGTDRPFAMYYALTPGRKPSYFGLAFD